MKARRLRLVMFVVLVLGLLGWWYWNSSLRQPESAVKNPSKASDNIATNRPQSKSLASGTSTGVSAAEVQALLNRPDLTPEDRQQLRDTPGLAQRFLQILNAQDAANSTPLDMYGKVVDQYGQPIAGVNVLGGILLNRGPTSGGRGYTTETNAQGRFSFLSIHGVKLGVKVQKEGYEYIGSLIRPDNYRLDPDNPLIFTMWKLKGAEPMVHAKIHDYIPCDGTEVHYDLLTGRKVSAGGDLVVSLTRNPTDIVEGKPFDWQLRIQIAGGGFVKVSDLYPNEAPPEGYMSTIAITANAADKGWGANFDGFYYFQARDRQIFGRIKISSMADFQPPPTLFNAEIYANPNGSRNLEWDPAKQIKPGR